MAVNALRIRSTGGVVVLAVTAYGAGLGLAGGNSSGTRDGSATTRPADSATSMPVGGTVTSSPDLAWNSTTSPFYTLTPCRALDTRGANGPALLANSVRSFNLRGTCGLSAGAIAVSYNLTITGPTVAGNLRLFAGGATAPLASAINYVAGQTRANHGIVRLGADGTLNVRCDQASGSTHFILDVTGYFGRSAAAGPLRVLGVNPRYFTDGSGRAIYLTGAHTWSNFQDNGTTDPPAAFDYGVYLDTLVANNHNFFRLWTWEQAKWTSGTAVDYWLDPLPWQRTGPGLAQDGKPRFDLTRFNESYFTRLRNRVQAAGARGFYVSVMLFNGWSVEPKGSTPQNDPWKGHPFNVMNNANGINGHLDPLPSGRATHTLLLPAVLAFQEAYVRKVVDAVNDLDNVLFEVSNESAVGSENWQNHIIRYVMQYEGTKPKRHPVGMTVTYPGGSNAKVFQSPATWVSPNEKDGYRTDPPAAEGSKVIITDTDHQCTWCIEDADWVWRSFTRGLNPILMDQYDGKATGFGVKPGYYPEDPRYVAFRRYMGQTRTYATRMDLAAVTPRPELCSTGYCLGTSPAAPRAEFLVFAPDGGTFTVDLTGVAGSLHVEWLDPDSGTVVAGSVSGGAPVTVSPPFSGRSVLFLHR